jgi:hypothetical protein
MIGIRHKAVWLLAVMVAPMGWGRVSAASAQNQKATSAQNQKAAVPGVELDHIVAIVNGDLILESDLDEERRMEAFQPFRAMREYSRERTIERLVDRTLILQQARLQVQPAITNLGIDAEFALLRKDIPACKEYDCETDSGWKKFVEAQGFTLSELREQWRQRMEVLRFIEQRFRTGIRISDADIKTYYETTLLPQYAKEGAVAPKLDTIAPRIQEILLQQEVSDLLDDWLKALRAQGSVQIMQPGQAAQ